MDQQMVSDLKSITAHAKTANSAEASRRMNAAEKAIKAGKDPVDNEQYGGKPRESKSWHMEQRRLKHHAASTHERWAPPYTKFVIILLITDNPFRVATARDKMGIDYIGYDELESAQGHRTRSRRTRRDGANISVMAEEVFNDIKWTPKH